MEKLELKNNLIDIINSSDEKFLNMVKALYDSYNQSKSSDFFDNLPKEIQLLLIESRTQTHNGNTRSHKNVMDHFKEKFSFSK